MSKRRINQQQSARIEKRQKRYCQAQTLDGDPVSHQGLVIKRYSRHAQIEDDLGAIIGCSIRPTIDTLVAGDRVIWQKMGTNQGVIVSRHPRLSVVGRPDKQGIIKPIAANITQIMIVVAPVPDISWLLLDCYLVMADYLNLSACIVLNKSDLSSSALQQQLCEQYHPLNYPIIMTGRDNPTGDALLEASLVDHMSVFVGQSGVGKSSLIAKLLPQLSSTIQTGTISESSLLGCHTTRNSCLYHLPVGGALIDSPGIRELGLWHIPTSCITTGFREFSPLLSCCKFRNCNHRDDSGCAIIKAVKNNLIALRRYENYVKIVTQFAK